MNAPPVTNEMMQKMQHFVTNYLMSRREFFRNALDGDRRDLDAECGYPTEITLEQYGRMYDRELGNRIVSFWPDATWEEDPTVFELEEPDTITPFEERWTYLVDRFNIWHYCHRVDELSRIGWYGGLLIGVNDGKKLDQPVDGIDAFGDLDESAQVTLPEGSNGLRELLFLRAFEQRNLEILEYEESEQSPRLGLPTFYKVSFVDHNQKKTEYKVHWHRMQHVADGRKSSEVFGTPAQQTTYNRQHDVRKIVGSSGEMFWKGGFPPWAFEIDPEADASTIDKDAFKDEMEKLFDSLQRYILTEGMSAKSMAPQVASPADHLDAQMIMISILTAIPKRVLMGSEQGELAASQDRKNVNKSTAKRQRRYATPMIVRPLVQRFIALRLLPPPTVAETQTFSVEWPDMNAPSEDEKAATAQKWTDVLAKYMQSGIEQLFPPLEFFTIIMGFTPLEAEAIIDAAVEHISEMVDRRDEMMPDDVEENANGNTQGQGANGRSAASAT